MSMGNEKVEKLARAGYLAKGVVYVGVGLLSAYAAFEAGQAKGSKDVLETIVQQPFGKILLVLLVLGLAGYATWRFVQAIQDPESKGTDGEGIVTRLMYFVSGVLHASLVLFGIKILLGSASSSSGKSGSEEAAATLMQQPFGRWLVGVGGVIVVAWAVYQIYKAWTADLSDRLDLSSLGPDQRQWAVRLGRAGIGARGIAFSIAGSFFVLAAYHFDPEKAQGLAESLRWLGDQPFGPWLMALVAVGLGCYGAYMGVKSAYRRIA